MGVQHTNWAKREIASAHDRGDPVTKPGQDLLKWLCDEIHNEQRVKKASQETVAKHLGGVSTKTVRRGMQDLLKRGLISVAGGNGRGARYIYRLECDRPPLFVFIERAILEQGWPEQALLPGRQEDRQLMHDFLVHMNGLGIAPHDALGWVWQHWASRPEIEAALATTSLADIAAGLGSQERRRIQRAQERLEGAGISRPSVIELGLVSDEIDLLASEEFSSSDPDVAELVERLKKGDRKGTLNGD